MWKKKQTFQGKLSNKETTSDAPAELESFNAGKIVEKGGTWWNIYFQNVLVSLGVLETGLVSSSIEESSKRSDLLAIHNSQDPFTFQLVNGISPHSPAAS